MKFDCTDTSSFRADKHLSYSMGSSTHQEFSCNIGSVNGCIPSNPSVLIDIPDVIGVGGVMVVPALAAAIVSPAIRKLFDKAKLPKENKDWKERWELTRKWEEKTYRNGRATRKLQEKLTKEEKSQKGKKKKNKK